MIHLKVGRAVNLNKRIDQWGKQCGSKEQVLRGWWPGTVEDGGDGDVSLMKARIKAGDKGANCHRLERLVHLELADLVLYSPYMLKDFPKKGSHTAKRKDSNDSDYSESRSGTPSKSPAKKAAASTAKVRLGGKPCPDCTSSLSTTLLIAESYYPSYRRSDTQRDFFIPEARTWKVQGQGMGAPC